MADVLAEEIEAFESLRADLSETDEGHYVLIKGSRLFGVFDKEIDAVRRGIEWFGSGPFLVKEITPTETPILISSHLIGV
ncbi:MAG: hypothetical protein O3A46_03930 [Candidatus Poribacteria bacterium]|nr:hypothetical protein [Candidatus Poribacteria bacterium]